MSPTVRSRRRCSKSMAPDMITLDDALMLLTLPRTLGVDEGEEVTAQNGRYGPYVKRGSDSRSLESEDQLFTVHARRGPYAVRPAEDAGRRAAAAPPLRENRQRPVSGKPMVVRDGRFGPVRDRTGEDECVAAARRLCRGAEPSTRRRATRRAPSPGARRRSARRQSARRAKAPAKRAPAKKAGLGEAVSRRTITPAWNSRRLPNDRSCESAACRQSRRRPARSRGRRRPAERQPVEIVDDERGMCLCAPDETASRRRGARRRHLSEPAAAASREGGRFRHLDHAEQVAVERPVPAPRTQPGSRSAHGP